MKRTLQTFLCLLAALHLVGGHWGVLQVIAWANMLRDYSKDQDVITAVADTFNGHRPCSMCLKIQEEKEKEEKNSPVPASQQVEKFPSWLALSPALQIPEASADLRLNQPHFALQQILAAQWRTTPPTPPPRCGGYDIAVL